MNEIAQASPALRPEALLQILEVTRKLAAPFDLQAVLQEIGEAARNVLRAERATVWLYEPETAELVLASDSADTAPPRGTLTQGILGLTARSRRVVNVPDCRAEPLFDPAGCRNYATTLAKRLDERLAKEARK